jgi:hypothetical protein
MKGKLIDLQTSFTARRSQQRLCILHQNLTAASNACILLWARLKRAGHIGADLKKHSKTMHVGQQAIPALTHPSTFLTNDSISNKKTSCRLKEPKSLLRVYWTIS